MAEVTEVTEKKIILIITGGNVDGDFAALWVKKLSFDYCIAVDHGAETALELGIEPDIVIGDLDSIDAHILGSLEKCKIQIKKYDHEKDITDTGLAVETALMLRPEVIYILGGTGNRADHMVTTLLGLFDTDIKDTSVYIVDKYNKIYSGKGDIYIKKNEQHGDYISLAVISESAEISMEGMKYNLDHRIVRRGSSLCQSNEIIGEVAHIVIHDGTVLVFESKD